ncbi:MAG TPA: IS4 family transposase [Stellaceae bacterium]|nr:IS4 family transposase [Stellaceae bacterium]HUK07200.1 IS4 family transposase [Stellaceae bacterium]
MDEGLGYFGDERRRRVGELLIDRMAERQEVCIRKLGDDRPEQVRFRRFLYNDAVTVEEMVSHRATFVAAAARGRHVLAIQDTSEINYQSQSGRKRGLGTVGNGSDVGLFVHPVLAVDAGSGECLGLVDAQVWRRTKAKAADYKKLPIEEKESYRWLHGADQAKAVLGEASLVTVVDDREGDIYEKWARLPDMRTHLLTRACRDRSLVGGGRLFATLGAFPEVHRYEVDLPARPNKKRSAHRAKLTVRMGRVRIRRSGNCSDPAAPAEIELSAIEVREIDAVPGEEPILWRLLTTHKSETVAQALAVIGWYCMRWNIEQLFRTLKRQGLRIEQSGVEDGQALEKLVVIALIAATMTMQLVLARSAGSQSGPASRVFDPVQIEVLHAVQTKLQGRTPKQQNPYPPDTLAWAGWTIARLGGWTGYGSDKSTGPITLRDGIERFYAIADGYILAKNVCPS